MSNNVLPSDPFQIAELIASFVLLQAAEWEHIPQVHDALCEVARKIRTADWISHEQCKTCDSRARKGLDGQCPSCANIRVRIELARERLAEIAIRMASADPNGTEIEHINHSALDATLALGRALKAAT